MIKREAGKILKTLANEFKVVCITGPRQSGKTTLAKNIFKKKPYVNLEEPDQWTFAREDPRNFLAQFPDGAVIDEIQRAPDLFSYIQGIVDTSKKKGRFIITGSQHFGLVEKISQSLAGRIGILHLLPFTFNELETAKQAPRTLNEILYTGSYPPIYDQQISPERWYNSYITTYIERDVRQLIRINDLGAFQKFIGICAGHIGQMINTSKIGSQCGLNHSTVRAWLNLLEASYIIFTLKPHYRNFKKRLVKTSKLYFYDTGLAVRLLGIEKASQLTMHPFRGALFENWVISELLKHRFNLCKSNNLFFWRNNTGEEVDIIIEQTQNLVPIEIKSGGTIASDWLKPILKWCDLAGEAASKPYIIYGGEQYQKRDKINIIPWNSMSEIYNAIDKAYK